MPDPLRPILARLGPPLSVIAAGLAAYATSFSGAMIFDDQAIRVSPYVRSLWPPWQALRWPDETTLAGRPLVCLSLAVNYAISGMQVWSYHLLNLAVHVLAGLTLLGVLRRTLQTPAMRPRWGASATKFGLTVALLWTVHPLLTESVTYITTRTESMMGLFLLLTLYCAIRSTAEPESRGWQLAAVIACGLGMASKQSMVGAPLLVLLYDRTFLAGSFRRVLGQRKGLYLGLALTWILLAGLVITGQMSKSVGFGFERLTPYTYALTQTTVILHYLRLALWPHPLVISYDDWPVVSSLAAAWPQALTILALLAATIAGLLRNSWLGFVGAWFFIILAPTSSFLPIVTEIAAERRMYLPLISVLVLVVWAASAGLGWAASRWPAAARTKPAISIALAAAGVLAGIAATARRNLDYRSEETIWTDTLAKRPDNLMAKKCLAAVRYQQGRYDEQIELLTDVVRAGRGGAPTRYNLALALSHQNRLAEAATYYQQAINLDPNHVMARANYADVLAALGRTEQAIEQLAWLTEHQPQEVATRLRLARLYEATGRLPEAAEQCRATLQINPTDPAAHRQLGAVLARQGRLPEARHHLSEAVRLRPESIDLRLQLAEVQMQIGELAAARQHIDIAIRAWPDRAEPHYHLATLLVLQGRMAEAIEAYRACLKLRPSWAAAANNLAWVLATAADERLRNPTEAVRLAEQACNLEGWDNPGDLDTLAAAYAAAGRFEEAIRTASRAIELASGRGQAEAAAEIERRLAEYRAGRPFVDRSTAASQPAEGTH